LADSQSQTFLYDRALPYPFYTIPTAADVETFYAYSGVMPYSGTTVKLLLSDATEHHLIHSHMTILQTAILAAATPQQVTSSHSCNLT
jgi:hypothetical protein